TFAGSRTDSPGNRLSFQFTGKCGSGRSGRSGRALPPEIRAALEPLSDRPEWDLGRQAHEAMQLAERSQQTGVPAGQLGHPDPDALAIAKKLQDGPLIAQRAFRQYATDAEMSRDGSQSSFFEPPTRQEAFEAAFGEQAAARFSKRRILRIAPEHQAQVSYRPGTKGAPGILYGNPAATELIAHLLGGNGFDGVNLPAALAGRVAKRARWELYNSAYPKAMRAELHQFADEMDRLVARRRGASYVEAAPGTPLSHIKGTAREEAFHAQQAQLGNNGTDVGHIGDAAAFMQDPLAERAGDRLVHRFGYRDDPDNLVAEIGAKLASGQWEQLGLSESEAQDLAYQYARALVVRHGPGVVFKLRRISPILKEAFHEAGRYGTEPPEHAPELGGAADVAGPLEGSPASP
ncbi:MAG: hypothetical protein ACRD4O_00335, partial [Bryobacteraceae bacterium]